MRVALLTHRAWLDEELPGYRLLAEALAGEGAELVQALPEELAGAGLGLPGEVVPWRDAPWAPLRARRLAGLAPPLAAQGVEVVHAADGPLWPGALALAQRLGVPAVLGLDAAADLARADRLAEAIAAARAGFAATTDPLAAALRDRLGAAALVEIIPPAAPPMPEPPARPPGPLCAAISGCGGFDADFQALFEAVRETVTAFPQALFFLDGAGSEQHGLWQAARRFELLANLSVVPHRLGQRDLLLQADVLLHPQAPGRSRGLLLQAMARGMPVLARADPWVDYLIEEQTAWLADAAPSWAAGLRRVMAEPARASDLGARARQWVRARHVPALQASQTAALYRRILGESIKFPGPGGVRA